MKRTINLGLFLILCSSSINCTNLKTDIEQTKELFSVEHLPVQENLLMKQDNSILSRDYYIAEKALNKAISEKDKETLKLGLKNSILTIQQKTAEAISALNDDSFVPDLIEALKQNQSAMAGGTEAQIFQDDLNKAILSTLEHLTKLKFNVTYPLSDKNIKEVLDKTQKWCNSHKKTRDKCGIFYV